LFADRVVVLSKHTERRFLDAGIAPERLRLIRPAIAPLDPPSEERRRALRESFGLPVAAPLVVYAGDLEFGRGAELALAAQRTLASELGAHLVMACRTKTPSARSRQAALAAEVEAQGHARTVTWLGETARIHELLALADLVTLPTDTLYAKMDLPLVLVEAMSLGRAVLVGEGTPAVELGEGDAARAVATNAEAVTAATRELLQDHELRRALGARARAAALERYSAERMAREYEKLYDELLA
jgi:phosphatidylinositol alpha-1,6-mannosyltransferase